MAAKRSTLTKLSLAATGLMLGVVVTPTFGQAGPDNGGNAPAQNGGGMGGGPGGGGPGGGGFGGGRFDPQAMRQRMMDNLKQQLGASDDEFSAIQPKIEKVTQLEREANPAANMRALMGRRGGGGGPGGGGGFGGGGPGGGNGQSPSAVQSASEQLRTTLSNTSATPDEITSKLTTLRTARAKAKAELTDAQKDLQGVLTPRQEAVLVEYGILE
jgi:hypothetical protein